MMTLYHSQMYDDSQPVASYWEATVPQREHYSPLSSDERCDVAIIGGGYTGLTAALHLARDYHVDVRLLEAGHIGWGFRTTFRCTGRHHRDSPTWGEDARMVAASAWRSVPWLEVYPDHVFLAGIDLFDAQTHTICWPA